MVQTIVDAHNAPERQIKQGVGLPKTLEERAIERMVQQAIFRTLFPDPQSIWEPQPLTEEDVEDNFKRADREAACLTAHLIKITPELRRLAFVQITRTLFKQKNAWQARSGIGFYLDQCRFRGKFHQIKLMTPRVLVLEAEDGKARHYSIDCLPEFYGHGAEGMRLAISRLLTYISITAQQPFAADDD